MKIMRRIWDDTRRGENIDLYVAVPVAVILAIFGAIGVAPMSMIASLTLVILALISTSLLANRYAVRELTARLGQNPSSFFYSDLSERDFETDLAASTDLWLVGVSLTTIIRLHFPLFESKLRAGHTIKALLVNPQSAAVEMAEMRAYSKPNIERARGEIMDSIRYLCELQESGPGTLEIRTIAHPLGHGVVATNPKTASGTLYIQNYPFRTEGGSRPKFVLKPGDGQWFDFYKAELENLWNAGTVWEGCDK